jgi:hypothetical protein
MIKNSYFKANPPNLCSWLMDIWSWLKGSTMRKILKNDCIILDPLIININLCYFFTFYQYRHIIEYIYYNIKKTKNMIRNKLPNYIQSKHHQKIHRYTNNRDILIDQPWWF